MKTRFAPSLTGYLHLGHVLHMLYVWGVARIRGAAVMVRMEDHDTARARPEYETAILENMEWLGFVPDEGIMAADAGRTSLYRQSDCGGHYAEALQFLKEQGLVYGCSCSRREILEQQPAGPDELFYPGTCAEKNLPLEGNTVRFRVPSDAVSFRDLALGDCQQAPVQQCGDFSLRDRHGQWTYQFCCVCDDIRHGVNLVVRGEDILPSTGRQIQLFRALGAPVPHYYHHPLVYDSAGEKLSKRQRSESISHLREKGFAPGQVIGLALHTAGLLDSPQPIEMTDALHRITSG